MRKRQGGRAGSSLTEALREVWEEFARKEQVEMERMLLPACPPSSLVDDSPGVVLRVPS